MDELIVNKGSMTVKLDDEWIDWFMVSLVRKMERVNQ